MLQISKPTLKYVILNLLTDYFIFLLEHYGTGIGIEGSTEVVEVVFGVPVELVLDVCLICLNVNFILVDHCIEKDAYC
jgi:hypothetical protein